MTIRCCETFNIVQIKSLSLDMRDFGKRGKREGIKGKIFLRSLVEKFS